MRGFCLKQGKENLAGGRGGPLNIKSNLKNNSGLIRVFEIYRINYCLLVLLKTCIFFFSHDVPVEVTSYDEATYRWVSATARDIAAILLDETIQSNPALRIIFFAKFAWRECLASNRRERFCSCSPAWPRWTQLKTSNYIKREFQIKQWVISGI